MADLGLTHVALETADVGRSVAFYRRYAGMHVVHHRTDDHGGEVAWISDRTRPFVIVLVKVERVSATLAPWAHLGVACRDRDEVDRLCREAADEGVLIGGPEDAGPPVGYWAFLRDPDGHTLELSFGQEVGLTVDEAPSTESRPS